MMLQQNGTDNLNEYMKFLNDPDDDFSSQFLLMGT